MRENDNQIPEAVCILIALGSDNTICHNLNAAAGYLRYAISETIATPVQCCMILE